MATETRQRIQAQETTRGEVTESVGACDELRDERFLRLERFQIILQRKTDRLRIYF